MAMDQPVVEGSVEEEGELVATTHSVTAIVIAERTNELSLVVCIVVFVLVAYVNATVDVLSPPEDDDDNVNAFVFRRLCHRCRSPSGSV